MPAHATPGPGLAERGRYVTTKLVRVVLHDELLAARAVVMDDERRRLLHEVAGLDAR